jgi:hypothetical protein
MSVSVAPVAGMIAAEGKGEPNVAKVITSDEDKFFPNGTKKLTSHLADRWDHGCILRVKSSGSRRHYLSSM